MRLPTIRWTRLLLTMLLLSSVQSLSFAGAPFIRGDTDYSHTIELTDAVRIFGFLFLGEPETIGCEDSADSNDDGVVDISDGINILVFLFVGTSPLPRPGFECIENLESSFFRVVTCEETAVLQLDYDYTTDDPYTCGDPAFIAGKDVGRPVAVHQPASYEPDVPIPLVLFLHGGFLSPCRDDLRVGGWFESIRGFRELADSVGFLYAIPDGQVQRLQDPADPQRLACAVFWNATDAMGGFMPGVLDDVGYLGGVIEEIREKFNVDEKRIYIIGRSNGGFMAHRLACDHAPVIAAVVSIAGATYLDPSECSPSAPVHVLQIHGTADEIVRYDGGRILDWTPPYPGAIATVEQWAAHNGCSLDVEEERVDVEPNTDGAETVITRYTTGCRAGGSAELWTIEGADHVPGLLSPLASFPLEGNPAFSRLIVDWLLAHPKP
jgi:polyhydroxybutyrate depolymerase